MGRHWRKYSVGKYRLGQLHKQAVVVWEDEDGFTHRRRLGVCNSEVEARAAFDRWVHAAGLIQDRQAQKISTLFEAYRADRAKDGKNVKNFDWDWKALAPRFASMDVDALTADVCRAYAQERLGAGKSVGTVWTELGRLRSCINWAAKRLLIDRPPYVWMPSKPEPKDRVLTEMEVTRLIRACKMPHTRLFVVLAITTAGRHEAICQLCWDKIDFEAGTIDLRRERENYNLLTQKKRKGRAIVAMTAEARAALLEAKAGALTDHVIEWDGSPIRCIRRSFMAAAAAAGLHDVTPHTLRHTVLTWLDEGGIPIERISKLAGHTRREVTEKVYLKPSIETLRPAADVIDMRLQGQKVQKK